MNVFFNERLKLDGGYWLPETTEVFNDIVSNFSSTLDAFKYYREVVVYYSSIDMRILLDNFQKISEFASVNYEAKLNLIRLLLLEVNAKDWNKYKLQREDMIYLLQESVGQTTHNVNNSSLAEATEYKFRQQKVAVMNLTDSEYSGSIPILVNRSRLNPPRAMDIVELDTFKNNKDLIAYIIENWLHRNYNHNPKHGENGKNVKQNKGEAVSPLECSIQEAAELLKFAVSTRSKAELYMYDRVRNKFIVYKAESPQVYHGYHPLNQDEVPQGVKDFLLKNLD